MEKLSGTARGRRAVASGGGAAALVCSALALAACGEGHRPTTAAHLTPQRPTSTVPHLVGLRVATVEARLRRAGLVERPSYSGSVGNPQINSNCVVVLSQGPAPGTRVAKGSPVGIALGICPSAMVKHYKGHRQ